MATKAFNSRDVDRLMKYGLGGILALGVGMGLLVVGSILGLGAASIGGYVAIFIAFVLLIYTTLPAFN